MSNDTQDNPLEGTDIPEKDMPSLETAMTMVPETDSPVEKDALTMVTEVEKTAKQFSGLKRGQRLGKCLIEKEIGRGGMGAVYLATHLTLDFQVAVKILPPHISARDPQFAERFMREAKLSCKMRHPNVIQVMDAEQDETTGICYIVMEYVDGGTVKDLIKQGAMIEKQAVDIAIGVAQALTAAAEFNVVHRDIKPENIMLNHRGQVKLADLGIAKERAAQGTGLTVSHIMMGTPAYIAPEQASDAKAVDARADIYSLGATLYHMLAGTVPFSGKSVFAVLNKMATAPTPNLLKRRPELLPELAELVVRMMDKNPANRPQDADELVKQLQLIQSKLTLRESKRAEEKKAVPKMDAPPPEPEEVVEGHIDRYTLRKKLGQGGFGAVFQAQDTETKVDVAIKALPGKLAAASEDMEEIRNNFALVEKLNHPSIAALKYLHKVKDIDAGAASELQMTTGDYIVVMEYVRGKTLSALRKSNPDQKIPVDEAFDIGHQVAAALDYSHSQKILHRDVKPSNVMILEDPQEALAMGNDDRQTRPKLRVKVLDFGLAAQIHSSMSQLSHQDTDTSGTRAYMAPEQWAGRRQASYTDQYALAVMLYELISGRVPFQSAFDRGDVLVMMSVVGAQKPEPLTELNKRQNAILQRALSKDPEKRFNTCVEFVDTLRAAGIGGGKSAFFTWPRIAGGVAALFLVFFFLSQLMNKTDKDPYFSAMPPPEDLNARNGTGVVSPPDNVVVSPPVDPVGVTPSPVRPVAVEQPVEPPGIVDEMLRANLEKAQKAKLEVGSLLAEGGRLGVPRVPVGAWKDIEATMTAADKEMRKGEDYLKAEALWRQAYLRVDKVFQDFKNNQKAKLASLAERETALRNKVDLFAPGLLKQAEKLREQADDLAGEGEYTAAVVKWGTVAEAYQLSTRSAAATQAALVQQKLYETEEERLSRHKAFSKKGQAWDGVEKLLKEAERSLKRSRDSEDIQGINQAAALWRQATERLPECISGETPVTVKPVTPDPVEPVGDVKPVHTVGSLSSVVTVPFPGKSPAEIPYERLNPVASMKLTGLEQQLIRARRDEAVILNEQIKTLVASTDWLPETMVATVPGVGMQMALVKPGAFKMGDPAGESDERPVKNVTISQPFWLGVYEVTQKEWSTLMSKNPSRFKHVENPVETVKYADSVAYCEKLTAREKAAGRLTPGYEYRLPTEAEWEFAARGGVKSQGAAYSGMDSVAVEKIAREDRVYKRSVARAKGPAYKVGRFSPNELGIYDMSGNLWEWCLDWYDARFYSRAPQTDPYCGKKTKVRSVRGGAYSERTIHWRNAARWSYPPTKMHSTISFRVAYGPVINGTK